MPVFLAAAGLTIKDMFTSIAKKVLALFILLAILSLLSGILPDDPFKDSILVATAAFQPFYAVISYFFPVSFAVSAFTFFVVWDRFIYLYRITFRTLTENTDVIESG